MTLAEVKRILAAHASLFRRAYVYGSVARGDQDELSDVGRGTVPGSHVDEFRRIPA